MVYPSSFSGGRASKTHLGRMRSPAGGRHADDHGVPEAVVEGAEGQGGVALEVGAAEVFDVLAGETDDIGVDEQERVRVADGHPGSHGVGLRSALLTANDFRSGAGRDVRCAVLGGVVHHDYFPHEAAFPEDGDHRADGPCFITGRDDGVDGARLPAGGRPHSEERARPARSPRVTNFRAILREASSIISSPNMTAPLRSSSVAVR